jgi:hypothetical protein
MYQLLSQWTADQAMDRGYDPDRLDRGPVYPRPVRTPHPGIVSRMLSPVTRLRAATQLWARRGTLGPRPDRCDPVRQAW